MAISSMTVIPQNMRSPPTHMHRIQFDIPNNSFFAHIEIGLNKWQVTSKYKPHSSICLINAECEN